MKTRPLSPAWLLLFAAAATTASAHPLHGSAASFTTGLAHPLGGWDHLLAMLAIGLWSAQLGRRAVWCVPATFVFILALAAGAGHLIGAIPALDQGAAASVLALGLLVGTATRVPVASGMALAALFAVFHGFAHGAELPAGGSFPAYGAGFILTSVALHLAGLGLGLGAARLSTNYTRALGWGVAAAGVVAMAA